MKFTKMQGAGNDYLYIDARNMEKDWGRLAIDMSNRHFGVGSDGIILIQTSDIADLKMRMFNSDGSEGEMCGNGIRCFAKYSLDKGIVPSTEGKPTSRDPGWYKGYRTDKRRRDCRSSTSIYG